jgi:tripartite-type tricarboxylate transporter receptor subunit TctC
MLRKRDLLATTVVAFTSGLIAATAILGSSAAAAETFPERPIRLLVPYAAGGGTDAIARLIAQGVSEKLGQQVIVENNGSAGGNLATQQAASAAPDGYTMLMANQGPMVVNPHLFKNVKVDPLTAFDPITLVAAAPLVVVVPQESPFTDIKQLIEDGKKRPGELTYGSAGNGSASHLATLLLAETAGLDMVHVPYKGAGPALTDVIGGRLDFMITTLPSAVGFIEAGTLRPLAVTTKERTKRLPEMPTIAESGWDGYEATAWYGFVVPKGTPPEIVARLREATLEAINSPQVRPRLEAEGADPIGNTPEEFIAFMKAESSRWADLIQKAELTLD